MKSKSFKELIVWQKAHQFVLAVYKMTKSFPKEEIFGLTSQFRRAAVSIPANIAEGYGRYHYLDKIRIIYEDKHNPVASPDKCIFCHDGFYRMQKK